MPKKTLQTIFKNKKKLRTGACWATINGKKTYFRSSWEIKYAEYLESLKNKGDIVSWEFEPDTFWFDKIKRGVRSYLPDFKILCNDGHTEYHEVKGWMDSRSKTKIKRMRIYHPNVILVVLQKKELKNLGLDI